MIQIGNVLFDDLGSKYIDDNELEYQDILHKIENDANYFTTDTIAENKNWIYLKEMSANRRNMIEWLDFSKNIEILELNAGCGINSSILANKANNVTSVDESNVKCMISANINKKCDNLTIIHADFASLKKKVEKKYDAIIVLGLVELFLKNQNDYSLMEQFLKDITSMMKKDGSIYIATNNKYGLRYWAGCPETITGHYFAGIEGGKSDGNIMTYSKSGIINLLKTVGLKNIEFYYPYPDYLFPVTIYSDEYLPQKGELSRNLYSFDRERLVLFDEEKVFDNLISDDLFSQYSNSYFVIAQGE